MPVFRMAAWAANRPKWCAFSACGLYRLRKGEAEPDYHYHDCDEYIIVVEGEADLLLEGETHRAGPRNCVCIPAGGKHRVLQAHEDLTLVWIYDALEGASREGHIPVSGSESKVPGVSIVKMWKWPAEKPAWSRLTDLGILQFPKGKVEMDLHYHDCHEFYFLSGGSLVVAVEGREMAMTEGDVCPIRIGDRHTVLEAPEDAALVWVEERLERRQRRGHLHDEDEPLLPLSSLSCRPALPKTKDYGIGVIGVGRIANERQIPSYLEAGLRVVAICDVHEGRLEETGSRFGIGNTFADYRQLLEQEDVQILDVLTQSWVRPEIVRAAVQAGKHVICEKPFARSMAEARSQVRAAESAGVKIAVHQPTRWYYPFALAKVLVQQGYIGEPYFYTDDRCHHLDTAYYEREATRWHVHLDDFLQMEWGAHPFDIARWMFGSEPLEVYWSGTEMPYQNFRSEMSGACVASFPAPLKAVFVFHMADQSDEYYWHFRVEGKEGCIKGGVDSGHEPPWLACFSKRLGPAWERVEWSGREAISEAHAGPMISLVDGIWEDRDPPNSGQDNINTVRFCLAALRSRQEGRPVSLEDIP